MISDTRVFRRSDPDFTTTLAVQKRLVVAGRVDGEEPPYIPRGTLEMPTRRDVKAAPLPIPDGPSIPLGETDRGTLHLDLNRLLAGRCLIQGSSGAGKSRTLRHNIEEAHDYLATIIVDPEGEFAGLADHIGAATVRASEIANNGRTAAARRNAQRSRRLKGRLTAPWPDRRKGFGLRPRAKRRALAPAGPGRGVGEG